MDYSYLEAKRSLDDRSINRRIFARFEELALERAEKSPEGITLLEIGAGSGSMIERLGEWGVLKRIAQVAPLRYLTVEPQSALAPVLAKRLSERPELESWDAYEGTVSSFVSESRGAQADILVAHAVLDLFSATGAARTAKSLLKPGGVLYASITFDGESYFEPVSDAAFDDTIRQAFHASMSREGEVADGFARKLLTALPREEIEIEDAGSSDWIIMTRRGEYPPRERDFLASILSMVESSVAGHVSEEERARWLAERRGQLERGELIYIAHQLDILARREQTNDR